MNQPKLGLLEWFRVGEYERVEQVIQDLRLLKIKQLRTGVSWADWHTLAGQEWYHWLLPKLSQEVEILPCFLYTPPSLGIAPRINSPPKNSKDYADFLDKIILEFGSYFEWVELWNEPNNLSEWDWTIDPEWQRFTVMIGGAAYWAQKQGKKTVLAGMSPVDPNWLKLMGRRGILAYIDAVGIHGFPGHWEYTWEGWNKNVEKVQAVLNQFHSPAEIWITETGFSTWQYHEHRQTQEFIQALNAPVKRLYWYGAMDLDPNCSTVDGFHTDEREYHFGFKRFNQQPKLLYRLWKSGGINKVKEIAQKGYGKSLEKPVLITGGAGFIGTNLAHRLLSQGQPVLLFDNLSRAGVEENLNWLQETHGDLVQIIVGDVRDRFSLRHALQNACQVYHLAAQVAVTTSVSYPRDDFEINALGTLNLLEELRTLDAPPPLLYTSTNKVYGNLPDLPLQRHAQRYHAPQLTHGISEDHPLYFHSPYGCSKGAADQYVLDYARTYGLSAVVFRMSCIYGPHQFGTEDQGWVAHFLIRTLQGKPITLYGDGLQVRDILFVDDLIDAFLLAQTHIRKLSGQAFNMGGGQENALSLLECLDMIGKIHGSKPPLYFDSWRPGDQRYYISDIRKFQNATNWTPKYTIQQGLFTLYEWLQKHRIEPQRHQEYKDIEQSIVHSLSLKK